MLDTGIADSKSVMLNSGRCIIPIPSMVAKSSLRRSRLAIALRYGSKSKSDARWTAMIASVRRRSISLVNLSPPYSEAKCSFTCLMRDSISPMTPWFTLEAPLVSEASRSSIGARFGRLPELPPSVKCICRELLLAE